MAFFQTNIIFARDRSKNGKILFSISSLFYLMQMKNQYFKIFILLIICQYGLLGSLSAKSKKDSILTRIFTYPEKIKTLQAPDTVSYAYMKSSFHINKRNLLLMAVPTMYAMAHVGSRRYLEESYNKVTFLPNGKYQIDKILSLSSAGSHRLSFPAMLHYLTPNIYDVTLINENVLSPFNRQNKIYYKYTIEESADSLLKLHFKPRLKNTLLVTGEAEVDARSGKISTIQLTGEYDMIFYRLSIQMGNHGVQSLTPQNCSLTSRFLFFGNDVRTHYTIAYHLPKILPNISEANQNFQLMEQIRPEPLTSYEKMVYSELLKDKRNEERDTTALDSVATPPKVNFVKSVLWDMIGENIFNDIHQDFGPNKAGSLRIDPILNPLYMEYSPSQGFYYNFNIRGGYHFSENSNIWLQLKGGYSFRLHQFSFWIPLIYYFDIRHNGFISSGISGGRRIQNGNLVTELRIATNNNRVWDNLNLYEFNDSFWDCYANYDFTPKIGIQAGFVFHRRTALNKVGFELINKPSVYTSLAPKFQVHYRPWGYQGPTLMACYEKSIKKLAGTNTPYTRWEFDGQYILPLHNVQSLSMRVGTGFYTDRSHNDYFVDFENFRQTFLPNGWNDEWSGEFELLESSLYNQSNYYVRANFTYESPFLVLAWTPLIGHFIERERLYLSALRVKNANPYLELGYAIKTRFLSIGAFMSNMNGRTKDFGFKFGFELFRRW